MNLFEGLTYRQKNYLLWGGSVVFALFTYWISISNTIDSWQTADRLETRLARADQAPRLIGQYRSRLRVLDKTLKAYEVDGLDNQEMILAFVSEFCQSHKLTLRNFPQVTVAQEKDFEVYSQLIEVEGRYTDLLKLVYELEQVHPMGRIASVQYRKFKDTKTRKQVLTATIHLQNIKFLKK